ncbi:MAG: glycerophosphodiester phosphodiesterase family protein [Pseudomonadota bacterium]
MTALKSLLLGTALSAMAGVTVADSISVGPRPLYLIERLEDGPLKDKLLACADQPVERTLFSIGHRGAPMKFPEHTVESNRAAAVMGAGILECDVTFTKDKELVCRHAQNDLHTTTDILASDLADTCVVPFTPADGETEAAAECRTSEITLAEYRTLTPKMDAADAEATTVEGYLGGVAPWRTTSYSEAPATLMTHAESIDLFKSLGAKFTPELKSPSVEMPFDGFSQADYAQKLIDEYKAAGIPPEDVWPQSFNLADVLYWIENEPEYGQQAVFLDEGTGEDSWNNMDPATWAHSMTDLKAQGVNYLAPALWMMLTLDGEEIVPSEYAKQARDAGLTLIAWTLERSGPLTDGGGWYFQSIAEIIDGPEDYIEVMDELAQDVGVVGIFSDWPGTVSYYASCMGLE